MKQYIQEASNLACLSSEDADDDRSECALPSHSAAGLFRRQLTAAGLESIADRIAAGADMTLDDAVQLSQASLPLLGRIVEGRPLPVGWSSESVANVGWTSKSVAENKTDSEVQPANDSVALPIARITDATAMPRQIAQPLTEWKSYCCQLIATRDELGASNEPVAWYPKVGRTPDENASSDNDYTGVEVLRAIALARLVLPENVQIVAPLAALGQKLAQVALDFGATHLGYVTCDGKPLEGPLAVNVNELNELRESNMPTSLKEEK